MDQIPALERQLTALKHYYGYTSGGKSTNYENVYHGAIVGVVVICVLYMVLTSFNNNSSPSIIIQQPQQEPFSQSRLYHEPSNYPRLAYYR